MISASATLSLSEKKAKNLLSMRPGWLRKEMDAAAAGAPLPPAGQQSPVSAKIRELTTQGRSKPKALSRPRIRELLTLAVILWELD
ncbi:hypothetical protein GGF46_002903 [Coemansia sp. RSA 552]|nr:hypothetical protein GGF46_002903 [Coemansia sp. RSA 552]